MTDDKPDIGASPAGPPDPHAATTIIHASTIRLAGKGVLIIGPSGTGKSSLALALLALGGRLVADDQTALTRTGTRLTADAPATIRGQIEARGVGLLTARAIGPTDLALIVDLGQAETQRLPPLRKRSLLGITLPLVHGPLRPGLAAALLQMLTGGLADPDKPGIAEPEGGVMEGTAMQDDAEGADQNHARPGIADAEPAQPVVLVTGPSGAGRSTAINVLEDLGYEAIDNLPLSLVTRLLDGPARGVPLALGLDVRNRDFSAAGLIALIDEYVERPDIALTTLYLDCAPDQLVRRYSETRRRHPLAPDDDPLSGVLAERNLMEPIRARADVLVDTTETSPHDLKAELTRWFGDSARHGMTISVQSFSYKRGTPRGIDIMFDVRFLENPHWVPELRALDGRDPAVQAYIRKDPRFAEFMDRILGLIRFLLPAHQEEGKSHLAIGIGCTGGQHRSVTVTEKLAQLLAQDGWHVSKRHRELERQAAVRTSRIPEPGRHAGLQAGPQAGGTRGSAAGTGDQEPE